MFKRLKVVGGSALAFSGLVILATEYVKSEAAAPGQMQREVNAHVPDKMQPVVVTKITLGDVTVQPGRFVKPVGEAQDPVAPFTADGDWVQNLTVYLFNRTNQTIVHAVFTFVFPETLDYAAHRGPVYRMQIGRIPPSVAFDKGRPIQQAPESQPIMFRPGQTMAIHLGDYIDQIKAAIEPTEPLAGLTKMEVGLVGFFFEDGLQWSGGFRAFDPKSSTWRRVEDPNFFPGDPDARWPGRPGWTDRQ
jgi:hypothetical protein